MPDRALRVALLAIPGTNCDRELLVAAKALGALPEVVQLSQFGAEAPAGPTERRLSDYDLLLLPGGFSGGDYVRAGAIFAARLRTALGRELEEFLASDRLVGGICNGFQVLTELGLLPGQDDDRLGRPEAALMTNDSGKYECRPTYVRWDGGRFAPLGAVPPGTVYLFPSGHAEGKLVLDGGAERLRALEASGQVLFRWVAPDGGPAKYPWNPNGSIGNVAGLTSPSGRVFGLMPHPERHFFHVQAPDWTRSGTAEGPGDGQRFLAAVLDHAARAR
ncbi:MAG TPA: phosphoribosylformylglycinamidine synthase I [Thermoplasmata archaeon]|nr:phosphoribosylformylglycinamidine synthase I [Thermoplasmata archaeon]